MKYNKLSIILGVVSIVLILVGCSKTETITGRLDLSYNSLSFDAAGSQTYTIKVESVPAEWDVESSQDWIVTSEETATSITVTVTANESTEGRSGKLTFTNGDIDEEVSIDQIGADIPGAPKFRIMPEFASFKISRSGKKGLGMSIAVDEQYNSVSTPYIVDLATDERTKLPSLDGEYIAGVISDDAGVVIVNGSLEGVAMQYVGNEWLAVDTPLTAILSIVNDISLDGSIWVGYIDYPGSGSPEKLYQPIKWIDGVMQEPLSAPVSNIWGDPMNSGSQARGCSNDGSIIYGTQWDNYAAIWWKDGEPWQYVARELQSIESISITGMFGPTTTDVIWTPWLQANSNVLSPSGKYLAMTYNKTISVEQQSTALYIPMFTDLETGESVLLEDITSGKGRTITDDGLFFYTTPSGNPDTEMVYDHTAGTSTEVKEWVKETYGITIMGVCLVDKVSPGGNTVVGEKREMTGFGAVAVPFYITTEGVL